MTRLFYSDVSGYGTDERTDLRNNTYTVRTTFCRLPVVMSVLWSLSKTEFKEVAAAAFVRYGCRTTQSLDSTPSLSLLLYYILCRLRHFLLATPYNRKKTVATYLINMSFLSNSVARAGHDKKIPKMRTFVATIYCGNTPECCHRHSQQPLPL